MSKMSDAGKDQSHRLFTAKAPGVLPHHFLGNELLTYVAVSHYLHGIPMGRIIKQLKIKRSALFGKEGPTPPPPQKKIIKTP